MKLMRFKIAFGSFLLTSVPLYLVGYVFTIPLLMLHYEYTDNENGFFVTTGSLIPLVVGVLMSLIAEKFYVYKVKQKLG